MQTFYRNTSVDKTKVVSVLCYMTILGWLIALILQGKNNNSDIAFHLRQSLGLLVTTMLLMCIPFMGWLCIFLVIGAWGFSVKSAFKGEQLSLPLIGNFYQKHLYYIN